MIERSLKTIIQERNQEKRITDERKQFRKLKLDIPISHWSSADKYNHYMMIKKKRHKMLIEEKDQRSKIAAMGAIKRIKFTGEQWINFVNWLDVNKKLGVIWHSIREVDEFKKQCKELFIEE